MDYEIFDEIIAVFVEVPGAHDKEDDRNQANDAAYRAADRAPLVAFLHALDVVKDHLQEFLGGFVADSRHTESV